MSADHPVAQFLDTSDDGVWKAWERLATASRQANPFSRRAYAETVRDVLGFSIRLVGTVEGDELRAGLLLFERKYGPYRQVVVPPLTPYTTPLFDPPLRETEINRRVSALDALIELLEGEYHSVDLHLHPTLTDVRPFVWNRWRVTPLYTHRLNLTEADNLLQEASKSVRKRVRQKKEDWTIEPAPETPEVITQHVLQSYERSGGEAAYDATTHSRLLERLRQSDLLSIYTARNAEGVVKGGQALLHDAHTAYSWTGAGEPGPAKTLMLWQTMLDMKESGLRVFDFVGANTPSIAEFKRSFGAPLVAYYRVEYVSRPELYLYRSLQRMSPLSFRRKGSR